jgi:hypothetical protein
MTKNLKKITAEKKIKFFLNQKPQLTYPLASIKYVQVTEEACSSQKRPSNTSKHEFFLLLWVIFALLDPDPDSEYGSGSGSTGPIEYGSNPDPDPKPCLHGIILPPAVRSFIYPGYSVNMRSPHPFLSKVPHPSTALGGIAFTNLSYGIVYRA